MSEPASEGVHDPHAAGGTRAIVAAFLANLGRRWMPRGDAPGRAHRGLNDP